MGLFGIEKQILVTDWPVELCYHFPILKVLIFLVRSQLNA